MNIAQPLVGAGSYYGKYFLLEKLATGGMGEVFLARQEGPAGFEKILVVKKILNHLTENKEFVELFLGEARLAARMNHRNVVQVFELGEHQGTYFIAMEYVAGKSLREVVDAAGRRKERIPPEIARAIAEQICDGASYAHNLTDITGRSLNIIHRDLNPQNVLLGFGGDVKVIDFGIAKSEISTVKTEAGMIKGKFLYMSPEQSLAKPLDKRSDVFAIGITLYEMLCGQNPFHKSNIVLTLEAIQRTEPSPPSELDPALAPFDPILAKALAKDRERRYADASEMQEDLRRIVLPRASERMTGFLTRLFRSPVEDGNRPPVDSDSLKITGSRNAPATPPSTSAASPGDSATSRTLLVSGPVRKDAGVRITTPRPSPRPGRRSRPRRPARCGRRSSRPPALRNGPWARRTRCWTRACRRSHRTTTCPAARRCSGQDRPCPLRRRRSPQRSIPRWRSSRRSPCKTGSSPRSSQLLWKRLPPPGAKRPTASGSRRLWPRGDGGCRDEGSGSPSAEECSPPSSSSVRSLPGRSSTIRPSPSCAGPPSRLPLFRAAALCGSTRASLRSRRTRAACRSKTSASTSRGAVASSTSGCRVRRDRSSS